ncbi:MAG: energy transducer TonB [Halioglobus sp.]
MQYVGIEQAGNDRLIFALFVAATLHAMFILGISFSNSNNEFHARQINVTLAQRPTAEAEDDAKHIAQVNQLGSGNEADFTKVATKTSNPMVPQQTREEAARPLVESQSSPTTRPVLTTTVANELAATAEELQKESESQVQGISPEVDRLNQQLAALEATFDEQTSDYSERPRVRRLSSVSTRAAVDAAYLHDWRQRLEAVGNKYYPEASLRYGIYGSLRLLVTIRADGSLEDIKILSSSGYAVLDEAAIKIVRLAAPFAPFPAELKATTDKLEIIRTWQFQENQLSSG